MSIANTLQRSAPKTPLDHDPEAITSARVEAGLSKRQLARKIKRSESLIGEIERGTRNCTPANLKAIAEALGCPVSRLRRKPGDER